MFCSLIGADRQSAPATSLPGRTELASLVGARVTSRGSRIAMPARPRIWLMVALMTSCRAVSADMLSPAWWARDGHSLSVCQTLRPRLPRRRLDRSTASERNESTEVDEPVELFRRFALRAKPPTCATRRKVRTTSASAFLVDRCGNLHVCEALSCLPGRVDTLRSQRGNPSRVRGFLMSGTVEHEQRTAAEDRTP